MNQRFRKSADGYWVTVGGKIMSPVTDKLDATLIKRRLVRSGAVDVEIVGGHTLTTPV